MGFKGEFKGLISTNFVAEYSAKLWGNNNNEKEYI